MDERQTADAADWFRGVVKGWEGAGMPWRLELELGQADCFAGVRLYDGSWRRAQVGVDRVGGAPYALGLEAWKRLERGE